jgi:hypothetical protein
MARQGELFEGAEAGRLAAAAQTAHSDPLPLLHHQLCSWQQRLADHQAPLFTGSGAGTQQGQLFASTAALAAASTAETAAAFNPLALQPQPLSFWRWPQAPLHGAALYIVLDRPARLPQPLLLYIGETARAEQRWKGEHDCKAYLAAYGEALHKVGLKGRLSISFWSDVPRQTRARRALEQALIRRWQPAFNKETRGRWATPFQADTP